MRGKQDSCGRADQAMGGKVESQLITPSPLPPLPRSLEELAENQPGPADIWAAAAHASSAQRFSGGDGSRRGGGRWAPGRNPYASAAPARSTPALAPARDRASTLPPSQNDVLMLPRKAASEVDPALLALADPRTGGAWVSNRELKLAPNSLVYGRRMGWGGGVPGGRGMGMLAPLRHSPPPPPVPPATSTSTRATARRQAEARSAWEEAAAQAAGGGAGRGGAPAGPSAPRPLRAATAPPTAPRLRATTKTRRTAAAAARTRRGVAAASTRMRVWTAGLARRRLPVSSCWAKASRRPRPS